MEPDSIDTDYLIVGAGATAMAFADTLLSESDARIVMVDRHHRPGGHWNDAYPFVRLHQPSAFYGVNSRPLGSGAIDAVGLNKGLYELASGAEVLDYFDQVMNQRFLPSGRVQYFPMSDCEIGSAGEHRITSLLSGRRRTVKVRRKLVNATHAQTAVPSTHPPRYAIAPGVRCLPLNELPTIRHRYARYVVVGSGKTGIDACLWLLQNGAPPAGIVWIMPRDAWYLNRAKLQPGDEFFERFIDSLSTQMETIAAATSVPDLFARLEAAGELLRLDPSVEPSVYRCATVTRAELDELRRIESIVRLGRIEAIEPTRIVLEHGSFAAEPDWLYVDCSANAIPPPPPVPAFDGDTINLLLMRTCQPLFSGALLAYVESHFDDDAEKNAMCRVVPSPQVPTDWIRMWAVSLGNRYRWGRDEGLNRWLAQSRLDGVTGMIARLSETDTAKLAAMSRYQASLGPAAARLPQWVAAIG